MRKTLLTLSTCALTALSGIAAVVPALQLPTSRVARHYDSEMMLMRKDANSFTAKSARSKSESKESSDLSMNWGWCDTPYTSFKMPAGTFKVAMQLTEDIATQWAGAELTAIQVANPVTATENYYNPIRNATVWLAESLDSEPFAVASGTLGEEGFQYSSISLDTPYVLEAGKSIYVGYTIDVPEDLASSTFPVVVDYTMPDDDRSAWLYSTLKGYDETTGESIIDKTPGWTGMSYYFGNICITATLCGDMLPTNKLEFPLYSIPSVVTPGEPFNFEFLTLNMGANKISDITLAMDIEGQPQQTVDVNLAYGPLAYNDMSSDAAEFTCDLIGNNIGYEINVVAINGEPVENVASFSGSFLSIKDGYKRNLVFEEATGTWCGWCVVGYAGMEYMRENYANDGFIGIAIHGGDEMNVLVPDDKGNSFAYTFADNSISGYPSSFLNRDWTTDVYPSPENLEEVFLEMVQYPAYAEIDAKLENVSEDGKKVKLSGSAKFALAEENANYGIAYTVIEDNVGPYRQANYMSGYPDEESYGFGSKPNPVRLMYNDVARNCSHPLPLEGSIPASFEAGKEIPFETEIDLFDVNDVKNYAVVAMVINGATGIIENACKVASPASVGVAKTFTDSRLSVKGGHGSLSVSSEYDARVYSIDGRLVATVREAVISLPAGAYVVSSNGRTVKVMVRE